VEAIGRRLERHRPKNATVWPRGCGNQPKVPSTEMEGPSGPFSMSTDWKLVFTWRQHSRRRVASRVLSARSPRGYLAKLCGFAV